MKQKSKEFTLYVKSCFIVEKINFSNSNFLISVATVTNNISVRKRRRQIFFVVAKIIDYSLQPDLPLMCFDE